MSGEHRFEIIWSPSAAKDVRDLMAYLERDSPARADAFLTRVTSGVNGLPDQPRLGRVVPELHTAGIDSYRELIIEPYRVVYRVAGRRIVVHIVCDSRRNFQDVLLEHLIRYEP